MCMVWSISSTAWQQMTTRMAFYSLAHFKVFSFFKILPPFFFIFPIHDIQVHIPSVARPLRCVSTLLRTRVASHSLSLRCSSSWAKASFLSLLGGGRGHRNHWLSPWGWSKRGKWKIDSRRSQRGSTCHTHIRNCTVCKQGLERKWENWNHSMVTHWSNSRRFVFF